MGLSASIVSRRHMLAGAGAAVTCLSLPLAEALGAEALGAEALRAQEAADLTADGFRVLRARAGSMPVPDRPQDAAPERQIWGFEGAAPGPLLRVKRGDELRVRLVNALPDADTVDCAIHWHGVRAANLMDGAPGLTQSAVAVGARFDYRIRPPDAGTFWYHVPWRAQTPAASASQRLHGALIVEETEAPEIDREHVLVFDNWPMPAHNEASSPAAAFRIMANGALVPDLAVRANERLRLRLINAAQARVVVLRLDRHAATVMAIDGQPSQPFRPRDDRIILGPGNTADLFIDATLAPRAVAPILWTDASGETPLARLVYDPASPVRAMPLAAPRPLPANPLPARLDLVHAIKLDLALDAFARGTAHIEPSLFKAKRGRTVMLALTNRQDFACAVHVHGHAFRLLDRLDDGWKPFWLATVVVDARQTARIAFLADNPGKWLIECVGIGHPETALAGWFEVA
jgi:FtsP/CotA-like multicopper oxidase with cupredoxin domain